MMISNRLCKSVCHRWQWRNCWLYCRDEVQACSENSGTHKTDERFVALILHIDSATFEEESFATNIEANKDWMSTDRCILALLYPVGSIEMDFFLLLHGLVSRSVSDLV